MDLQRRVNKEKEYITEKSHLKSDIGTKLVLSFIIVLV